MWIHDKRLILSLVLAPVAPLGLAHICADSTDPTPSRSVERDRHFFARVMPGRDARHPRACPLSSERKRERLADADLLIGAIAVARGAMVVTGNKRHFERIPGVEVEDWIRG